MGADFGGYAYTFPFSLTYSEPYSYSYSYTEPNSISYCVAQSDSQATSDAISAASARR